MRLAYIKDDSEMEYIFREGINLQHSKVVSEIRPQFLEWICEKKGMFKKICKIILLIVLKEKINIHNSLKNKNRQFKIL